MLRTVLNITNRLGIVVLALAVALPACGDTTNEARNGLLVVATTSIWGDIASEVVGSRGTVEVLMPLGADPHDYRASARQVALFADADLVVANGLGLEENLEDALAAAAGDGANVLEMAPLLDPLPFGTTAPASASTDPGNGDLDPHVWMDPQRVAKAAGILGEELTRLDPSNEAAWSRAVTDYTTALEAADDAVSDALAGVATERRLLVTDHDALSYFAARYGFEVAGVIVPGGSTLAQPGSRELADLATVMARRDIGAIFTTDGGASQLAEALAAEVGGVQVVDLLAASLAEPGMEGDRYLTMIVADAVRIAAALGDR